MIRRSRIRTRMMAGRGNSDSRGCSRHWSRVISLAVIASALVAHAACAETPKYARPDVDQIEGGNVLELLGYARELVDGAGADTKANVAGAPTDRIATASATAPRRVLLSLSHDEAPASVARGEGKSWAEATRAAVAELQTLVSTRELAAGRLKLDAVSELGSESTFTTDAGTTVDRTAEGIWWLEADLMLLADELLGRRLSSNSGSLRRDRLVRDLAQYDLNTASIGDAEVQTRDMLRAGIEGQRYRQMQTVAAAEDADLQAILLYRGNPALPAVDAESLLDSARLGGDYLLRHQRANGRFNYAYNVKADAYKDDYNLLRHAGTCYALIELADATGDRRYLEGARSGLQHLTALTREPRAEHADAEFEALVSPGGQAKLGGSALMLLAMSRFQQVEKVEAWLPLMTRLARFLVFQQSPQGRYVSKYFYPQRNETPFESIYYPGEATLALARFSELTGDRTWLRASVRGADFLITVRDAGKQPSQLPHDHWLLMALDELHRLTEDAKYLAHAQKIGEAILNKQRLDHQRFDWIGSYYDPPRSTPTATRSEALVAMIRLAQRNDLDPAPYRQAIERAARFQLRTQVRPESAFHLHRPDLAIGGFRRSLDNFQIRIDYVQHNMSALLGLRELMLRDAQ